MPSCIKGALTPYFIFQGELVYEIVGDYPGPDFFSVDASNGELKVIQGLKSDSLRSDKYVVSFPLFPPPHWLSTNDSIHRLSNSFLPYQTKISLWFLQLRIVAYDSTYPENQATATVSLSVERNPNAPTFVDKSYVIDINEKFSLGTVVMTIRAEDDDAVRMNYAFLISL